MKNLLFILLLVAIEATAQDTLDINKCRELALEFNKDITSAKKKTVEANYTAKSYKGNYFPSISANAMGLYSNADGTLPIMPSLGLGIDYEVGPMVNAGVSLSQPIYMGGKIRSAVKMANLGEEIAEANEVLTTSNVILATSEAYALLVRMKELKKVAEKYNELLKVLYDNVQKAYDRGAKGQNDVLKVQVKLSESEISLCKADNGIRLATMNLCHYIGFPLDSVIYVNDNFPAIETTIGELTLSNRPETSMLDRQLQIADYQIKISRSEQLPKVGLMASYGYTYGFEFNDEKLFNSGDFLVLLNVSIPIYHFGEKHNQTMAVKVQKEEIMLQRQQTDEKMTLEIAQCRNNYEESQLQVDLAEKALAQAEENLRVSQKQFDAGRETLSDHLEAQALWQSAYQNLVDANFSRYISYLALQKAVGEM